MRTELISLKFVKKMETFKLYEEEFLNVRKMVDEKVKIYDGSSNSADADLKEIDDLLRQAEGVLKEMSVGLDSQTKKAVSAQLSDFKTYLIDIKNSYEKVKLKQNKSSLMGDKSFEDRQKMMDTNSK